MLSFIQILNDEALRFNEVKAMTKLGKTTIYKLIKEGRFPKSVRMNGTGVAYWRKSDVDSWIKTTILDQFC